MEKKIFDDLKDSDYWYNKARKNIITCLIKKNFLSYSSNCKTLDFGAGVGSFIDILSKFSKVDVVESNQEALSYLKKKYRYEVKNFISSFKKINDEKYDFIISLDCIEHMENDKEFVEFCKKNLKKNGKILITVPALKYLWSKHDVECHHFRRYYKKDLIKLFSEFKIIKIGYFNFFMFFPVFIRRKLFYRITTKDNDIGRSTFINKFLYFLFNLEKYFVNFNIFPIGVSLFMIMEKKK